MNLNQLSYFKKVAETGGISHAAAELLLTQPAVSKQIMALEEELGERLFDRIGKKMYLTHAGDTLMEHAEKILRSVDEAKTAVRDISAECSGELLIGASDHISIHRLPGVLKAYITAFPKVDLKLRCHRSETILEMVGRNQVDLGVITLPRPVSGIIPKPIWRDRMSLVCAKGHPLGAGRSIRLGDAIKYNMILMETGTETRRAIDEAFSGMKLSPHVTMEVAYIETVKGLVRAGLGISILPEKAVEAEVKSGALMKVRISDAHISRDLGLVYLKDKFLSRPATEFIKILDKF
jgi:DNA-binding transcriptional LysR family regulator